MEGYTMKNTLNILLDKFWRVIEILFIYEYEETNE
jgi:hypothetical protein